MKKVLLTNIAAEIDTPMEMAMEMLSYNKNIMQKFPYEQNVIIKKFVTNTTRIKQT